MLKTKDFASFLDKVKASGVEFASFYEPYYDKVTALASTKISDLTEELSLI